LSQQSTEAARMPQITLSDIPQVLIHGSTTYELRGVISFRQGKSNLRNLIGHYQTYLKRAGGNNWEFYDDLRKNPFLQNPHQKYHVNFYFIPFSMLIKYEFLIN